MRIHVYDRAQVPENTSGLLVAGATVPVRGLFALACLFGIGIGPANLWLLARLKRRIWLWWNVPAISLATCLAVFGYSLASEGWTGHNKTASFTLLDERCHRATSLGYVSYYCPLTPSSGPQFSVDTDATLLSIKEERYSHRDDTLRYVDWTNDQHLVSGWVNARVPTYFQLRKNENRRERLTVAKRPDGAMKVVNALGADISRLCVADAEGCVFEGRNIPAGAERILKPSRRKIGNGGGLRRLRSMFENSNWLSEFAVTDVALDPIAILTASSYVAYVDRSPFIEPPIAGVVSEDTVAIVYGILKGDSTK